MKKIKGAFSLLELIVVLTVMGIIATFGYQKFTEVMMESKATQLASQLNKIEVGLNNYYAELGTYPLDVKWLVTDDMDKDDTNIKNYDSLSLKLNGTEDEDVKQYWAGPYIKDMKTQGDTIQAVFGDQIAICATVTLNGQKSKIESCDTNGDVSDPNDNINVLIIKGVDSEAVKYLFKKVNGRDMVGDDAEHGNAYHVANGTGNKADKLGVPSRENYGGATPFLIYKFTDNIQND